MSRYEEMGATDEHTVVVGAVAATDHAGHLVVRLGSALMQQRKPKGA
jgi:hypothetical protein